MGKESKLRVCMVSHGVPPDFTGSGLAAVRLAARLETRGVSTFMIALEPRPSLERWAVEGSIETIRLRARFASHLPLLVIESSLRMMWWMWLKRGEFDVVHCHSLNWFSVIASGIARLMRRPVLISLSVQGELDASRRRKRWAAALANVVVSKSVALTEECVAAGFPRDRLVEITNAVDVEMFCPSDQARKRQLRVSLGLPEEALIVLFVGGMTARKGVDIVVEAFARIAPTWSRAHLCLVGPVEKYLRRAGGAAYIEELVATLESAELKGRVTVTGKAVKNVVDYMQASDVFLFPSKKEGFPSALIEAMACGLTVATSRLRGITDMVVDDGVNGFVIESSDPEVWAKKLLEALQDKDLRARVGKAARERVTVDFSPESIDAQYVDLYARLLGQRVRRKVGRR